MTTSRSDDETDDDNDDEASVMEMVGCKCSSAASCRIDFPAGHYCVTNLGPTDATPQAENQGAYCLLGKTSEILESG